MIGPQMNYQNLDNYKRDLQRVYKRIFSGVIKESFLIEMVNRIEKDQRYANIFLSHNDVNYLLSAESVATGNKYDSLALCKMIAMCHYANTVSMTDYERGKCQNDESYKNHLINNVLMMFHLEKITIADFSHSSLESFLPIIYYVSALNNIIGAKYDEVVQNKTKIQGIKNADFNLRMLYKIIIKIKACISLINLGATDELMTIYRTLIELFMTFASLWDQNEEAIKSYEKFDKVSFEMNYGGSMPDDLRLAAKRLHIDPVKYANYGWILNIEDYQKIKNKHKSVGLGTLASILDIKCGYFCPNFGSELYKFYKAGNPQTHGTLLIMNYFQLELHIFQNIAVMIKYICHVLSGHLIGTTFKYGDLDLVDVLSAVLNDSRKVYDWLNSNEKNLEKTNNDYRNRIVCTFRMK